MNLGKLTKISFCLFVLIFCASCTSMKPMEEGLIPNQVIERINPGDEIIIHTISSEKHLIIVESISKEEITGDGKTFHYSEIREIHKEGTDILKTTGAVVGGTYAALIIGGLLSILINSPF